MLPVPPIELLGYITVGDDGQYELSQDATDEQRKMFEEFVRDSESMKDVEVEQE